MDGQSRSVVKRVNCENCANNLPGCPIKTFTPKTIYRGMYCQAFVPLNILNKSCQ